MDWYRRYKNPFDVDRFYQIALEEKRTAEKFIWPNYKDYGMGHIIWKVKSNEILDALDSFCPIDKDYIHSVHYWEYHSVDRLTPHIDSLRGGNMIVPLIGSCEIKMWENRHNPDPEFPICVPNPEQELDSITFGPEEVILMDVSNYLHSVHPIEQYRIVIQATILEY